MVAADGDAGVLTLVCPNCAARFVVGRSLIGPDGRKVKCTACGERWMAYADGKAPVEVVETGVDTPETAAAAPEPEAASKPGPDVEPAAEAAPEIVESEPEPVVPVAPEGEDDNEVEADEESAPTLEDVPELVEAEETGENTLTALRAEMVKATKVSFLGTDLFGIIVLLVLAAGAAALIYFAMAAAPK